MTPARPAPAPGEAAFDSGLLTRHVTTPWRADGRYRVARRRCARRGGAVRVAVGQVAAGLRRRGAGLAVERLEQRPARRGQLRGRRRVRRGELRSRPVAVALSWLRYLSFAARRRARARRRDTRARVNDAIAGSSAESRALAVAAQGLHSSTIRRLHYPSPRAPATGARPQPGGRVFVRCVTAGRWDMSKNWQVSLLTRRYGLTAPVSRPGTLRTFRHVLGHV
jgi:hypothetical protein